MNERRAGTFSLAISILASFFLLLCLAVTQGSVVLSQHPRLIATDEAVQAVLLKSNSWELANELLEEVYSQGNQILLQPPVTQPPLGAPQVHIVRKVVGRLMTLGLLHRIEVIKSQGSTSKWYQRAKEEMLAYANFTTWNPAEFLDVGEGSYAMAIGIDWFYDALEQDSSVLQVLEQAVYEKSFLVVLQAYEGKLGVEGWWVKSGSNWNQVCNSGVAMAALGLLDSKEEGIAHAASQVYSYAMLSLPHSMAMWAPQGLWWEGPIYTDYSAKYITSLLASCVTALGQVDCGLDTTGMEGIGLWVMNSIGPSGFVFDWADSQSFTLEVTAANMFYFATRYNNSAYAYTAKALLNNTYQHIDDDWGSTVWSLLFYAPYGVWEDVVALPRNTLYEGRHVGFFRSEWSEIPPYSHMGEGSVNASYLAFKGGDNTWIHNHLDEGSFVFESEGVRWAWDLGAGNYSSPSYFNPPLRWSYYATNSTGHNVLQFDGRNQITTALSPILSFNTSLGEEDVWWGSSFAIINTTAAYADILSLSSSSSSILRGLALMWPLSQGHTQLIVVDDIGEVKEGVKRVQWNMHTIWPVSILSPIKARITPSLPTTTTPPLNILAWDEECPGVTLSVEKVVLPPPQKAYLHVYRIQAQAPASTCRRMILSMGTTDYPSLHSYSIHPISSWPSLGPLSLP